MCYTELDRQFTKTANVEHRRQKKVEQKTIIEEYMDHVYKLVLILLAASCAAAGVSYAGLKLIGVADFVRWSTWAIYILICVIYTVICVFVIKRQGMLKSKIRQTKNIMFGVLMVQTNILYIFFPGKTMWGIFVFFCASRSFN